MKLSFAGCPSPLRAGEFKARRSATETAAVIDIVERRKAVTTEHVVSMLARLASS